MKTWGLRAAGWMAMFTGLTLMTRILYTLGRCGRGWGSCPRYGPRCLCRADDSTVSAFPA